MKLHLTKRLFSILLALVMVIGLVPAAAIPVFAQNITGLIYASGIRANEGVVLMGDTTLNMDTDLTVPSIEGDYNLTVQGSGKLTVNGSGNGIDVKSLSCSSDLFIQTGWHAIEVPETVYINNAESFIVGGIYAAGHIDIRCNNATIAGNSNAISSALGSITLNGTFDIGANECAVNADVGNIYMDGDFRLVSDKGWTMDADNGGISVDGSLKVSSGSGIQASKGFSFYGTTLDIEGVSGIDSGGDISITATSTRIVTNCYSPISGEYVYIDSDYLFLQNLMEEENHPLADWSGISADRDVSVTSNDATIIGKYGISTNSWIVDSDDNLSLTGIGNVNLTGNFYVVGMIENAILCSKDVTVEGSLTAQGSVIEQGSDNPFYYGICSAISADNFSFKGTTLDVKGYAGISATGIDIEADSVSISTDVGDALFGKEVYVATESLWAENKATKTNEAYNYGQYGIHAQEELILDANGTVVGYDAALHSDNHYVYVNGSVTAVSKTDAGMSAPNGNVNLYGGPMVAVGDTHGISAKCVTFEGGSLTVTGPGGIYADEAVDLQGSDVNITAFNERRSGIWVENGYVDLKGKVVIETNGWYGINADTHVAFEEGYYQIIGPKNDAQAVKAGGFLYLDGTLEIIQPDGGHVNGNNIYGAGDSPALNLEMYSAIRDVSLLIDGPRDGKLPDRNASDVYFLDPRCTVESIVWYEDGEEMVSQDALFRAGHRYTVKITLSADDPYRFVSGVMGKVNGKSVTTGILDSDKKGMILTADMGECPKSVSTVELTIAAPVEGKAPSTAVTDPASEYGVYSRDVRWSVSTDGINFVSMASGEKFVGGKYYRVFMDVNLAGKDYKFPVTTASGTVQPDVVSYVNGNPAVTEKAYDQDPETVITVYFDFGKCNDFLIEEITIVDVVAPVAGQHPTYTANMFGTGYHVDTTKNAYEDIYWKNPPEKWYYVKNGISWWDVTDGGYDYVYENDVFLPGHEYRCEVYVAVEDGYEFVQDLYTDPETWPSVTVNGNPGELTFDSMSGLIWNQEAAYTFTCEENEVSRIVVDGITAPNKGQAPDYTAILGNPDLYTLDTDYGMDGSGIYWYDCEGRQLEAGERFGDAGPYRMAIKFVPINENGAPLCTFANDVDVMINGKYVTPYGDWDDIVVGNGAVWAFFTFRNSSTAPELSVTVSGTVTSFNDASGTVTLQLYRFNSNTPSYETTVKGNTVNYSFSDVAAGVYTLKVSKANHVTRTYAVTVGHSDLIQDVKLHLKGDVDGSGSVNMGDFSFIYAHVRRTKPITDDYMLLCADATEDGNVNMGDFSKVYAHVKGTSRMW